jgi:hypothetical protein
MTRITRTLTAAGLALSIAIGTVGASATPARANNEDAVAIIGGLIALYAIGQALQNDNRNVTVTRNYGHRPSAASGARPPASAAARGARALLHRGERPERLFPRLCPALHAEQRPACRSSSAAVPAPRRNPAWAPDDLWRPLPGAERLGPRGRFPALRGHPQPRPPGNREGGGDPYRRPFLVSGVSAWEETACRDRRRCRTSVSRPT